MASSSHNASKATGNRSQHLVDLGRVVRDAPAPNQIINRTTAKWLLNDLKRDALLYRGFTHFANNEFDQAKQCFERGAALDAHVQSLKEKGSPSLALRLEIACAVRFFVARPEEASRFDRRSRTILQLADFYALWERWPEAEALRARVAQDPKARPDAKAYVAIARAEAIIAQGRVNDGRAIAQKVVDDHPKSLAAARAMLILGSNMQPPRDKRVAWLQQAYKQFPNSDHGQKALANLIFIHAAAGELADAKTQFATLKSRHPQNRFIAKLEEFIHQRQKGARQ